MSRLHFDSPEHTRRFAAACWVVARWLYHLRDGGLDVTDRAAILESARQEIEAAIAAKSRGERYGENLIELCAGAVAVREIVPLAKEWNGATALLRSPTATKQYDVGHDFASDRRHVIIRTARVLADKGRMSAAQALWLADQPAPARQAA